LTSKCGTSLSLHARAVAVFVRAATAFTSTVRVENVTLARPAARPLAATDAETVRAYANEVLGARR
jgi:hypothetical protein